MSAVAEIQNEREYAELLAEVLPHVIHTEEENECSTIALEKLLAKSVSKKPQNKILDFCFRDAV